MRALLALTVVLACSACSSSEAANEGEGATADSEVNGGMPAKDSPAVGLLVSSNGGLCSGTLVAPRWVLTAGHCAGEITDFYTGLGAPARGGELERVLAEKMVRHPTKTTGIAHPDYVYDPYACPARGPDVALVELETPIEDIAPVAIAPLPEAGPVWCQPIGFGTHTMDDGDVTLGEKRYTSESVTWFDENHIATRRLRGPYLYGMSAPGDSGGPLFCRVTKTSFGRVPPPPGSEPRTAPLSAVVSCGSTPSEGVYALVSPVIGWITEVTGGDVR